jgi:hypothetical protein
MNEVRVCSQSDVVEEWSSMASDANYIDLFGGVRHAVISAPDWAVHMTEDKTGGGHYIERFCVILWYGCCQHKGQGHKKTMVKDEKTLLDNWEALIVGLSTAHSKDDRDQHEHDIDEALSPILSAPVKQIREMFGQLVDRLKANKKVPFYTWRSIEIWYERVVLPAKADKVIKLKTKLATEIAQMVEDDVKADIGEAIVGALMWRDQETLAGMKTLLTEEQDADEPRAKAKVERKTVGRQSCIFLTVRKGKEKKTVML